MSDASGRGLRVQFFGRSVTAEAMADNVCSFGVHFCGSFLWFLKRFSCVFAAESAAEVTQDLKLHEKNFVFMPINDNQNVSASGGSHWSVKERQWCQRRSSTLAFL